MLRDGMLLYHGSYSAVTAIDLKKCASGKDFGKGFYLTDDIEQAEKFISTSLKKAKNLQIIREDQNSGFVSVFKYHEPEISIPSFYFDVAGKEWLWFVALNRRSNLAHCFEKKLDCNLLNSEIVVGKIANDTTNPTITAYLNGLYGDVESESAVNFAIGRLQPNRLKEQYCFITERAIACLEPMEIIMYGQ